MHKNVYVQTLFADYVNYASSYADYFQIGRLLAVFIIYFLK